MNQLQNYNPIKNFSKNFTLAHNYGQNYECLKFV